MSVQQLNYSIGIDVGDRSVGCAAIELDPSGNPRKILSALTYRHDGGTEPGTEKSPESRLAARGNARRVRNMIRRRKSRLKKLDHALKELGYPVPEEEIPQTYQAWDARDTLASVKVKDSQEQKFLLSLALRHIARHRGWRNPYHSFSVLSRLETPTESFGLLRERAKRMLSREIDDSLTFGQVCALAAKPDIVLRARSHREADKRTPATPETLLSEKPHQADLLAEVRWIWEVQGLPDEHLKTLSQIIFHQEKPSHGAEVIGRDALPGQRELPRALRASLNFQEYRIRGVVSNLRLRYPQKNPDLLQEDGSLRQEQQEILVQVMMGWGLRDEYAKTKEAPTWADIADILGVDAGQIKKPEFEDSPLAVAPFDRTSAALNIFFSSRDCPGQKEQTWWKKSSQADKQALITLLLDHSSSLGENDKAIEGVAKTLEEWDEETVSRLEELSLEHGRVAYSEDSLRKLSDCMARENVGVYEARKIEFGVDNFWEPPLPSWTENVGQPTVDRVLNFIRKFVLSCERNWGPPSRVNVEHVRSALMGPSARAEYQREVGKRRADREKARKILQEEGSETPTAHDIMRRALMQRQQQRCLYCAEQLNPQSFELDHIVPRSGGGSNVQTNLAAVCRACNASKGKLPFAAWAEKEGTRGSLEIAQEEIRKMDVPVPGARARKTYQNRMLQRVRQRDYDEPVDGRSLMSTAYSALAVRDRLQSLLNEMYSRKNLGDAPQVNVYSGKIVSSARRASGIDKKLLIADTPQKSRLDFRHHAIDALVIAMMDHKVLNYLSVRDAQYQARKLLKNGKFENWKHPDLDSAQGFPESFLRWNDAMNKLSDLALIGVEKDQISVINSLRLTARASRMHEDQIRSLERKPLGESWTDKELSRIVDSEIYESLALGVKKLPKDPSRCLTLGARTIDAQENVDLFSSTAASIAVRGGSAVLGSIHHARILGWKDLKNGKMSLGAQRIFLGEFAQLFPKGYRHLDLTSVPVPLSSQSVRDMQGKTQKAHESGITKILGIILAGDEIELDLSSIEDGLLGVLGIAKNHRINRWRVSSFADSGRLWVRPLYISSEASQDIEDPKLRQAVEKGERISYSALFALPNVKVIRRTALGKPRWRNDGHGHASWEIPQVG